MMNRWQMMPYMIIIIIRDLYDIYKEQNPDKNVSDWIKTINQNDKRYRK